MLSNGGGDRVDEAPVQLVEDYTRFRNRPVIINPGSCIQCHLNVGGLQQFTYNELIEIHKDPTGLQVFAKDSDLADRLEAFHLGELKTELEQNNERLGVIVEAMTGVAAKEAGKAFKESLIRYDAPLGLEETARELRIDQQHWRRALAAAGDSFRVAHPRIYGLVHNRKIPRTVWEDQFQIAYSIAFPNEVIEAKPAVIKPFKPINPAIKLPNKPASNNVPNKNTWRSSGGRTESSPRGSGANRHPRQWRTRPGAGLLDGKRLHVLQRRQGAEIRVA